MKKVEQPTLQQTIANFKVSQELIAHRMNMPLGTFKKKISDNLSLYHFTEEEQLKALKVLSEVCQEKIKEVQKAIKEINKLFPASKSKNT